MKKTQDQFSVEGGYFDNLIFQTEVWKMWVHYMMMMMTAMQDILQCLQMERGQWVSRNINEEGGRGNLLQRGEFSTFYFLLHTTGGPEGSSLQVEILSLSVIALTFPVFNLSQNHVRPHISYIIGKRMTTRQPWSFHNRDHLDHHDHPHHLDPTHTHIIVFSGVGVALPIYSELFILYIQLCSTSKSDQICNCDWTDQSILQECNWRGDGWTKHTLQCNEWGMLRQKGQPQRKLKISMQ